VFIQVAALSKVGACVVILLQLFFTAEMHLNHELGHDDDLIKSN
jgi:hypothetical protein